MQPFTDMNRTGDLIADEEVCGLLVGLGRGQKTFNEEQGQRLVKWAHAQRIGAVLVDMILQGKVWVSLESGAEPVVGPIEDQEARV